MSPEQTKVLEAYFDKTINVSSLQNLMTQGGSRESNRLVGFVNSFLRRSMETDGRSLLDLTTGQWFNRLSKREQMAIANMLADPDPKNVAGYIKKVAEHIEIHNTTAGPETRMTRKVGKGLTSNEARNTAKRLLMGAWLGQSDSSRVSWENFEKSKKGMSIQKILESELQESDEPTTL